MEKGFFISTGDANFIVFLWLKIHDFSQNRSQNSYIKNLKSVIVNLVERDKQLRMPCDRICYLT